MLRPSAIRFFANPRVIPWFRGIQPIPSLQARLISMRTSRTESSLWHAFMDFQRDPRMVSLSQNSTPTEYVVSNDTGKEAVLTQLSGKTVPSSKKTGVFLVIGSGSAFSMLPDVFHPEITQRVLLQIDYNPFVLKWSEAFKKWAQSVAYSKFQSLYPLAWTPLSQTISPFTKHLIQSDAKKEADSLGRFWLGANETRFKMARSALQNNFTYIPLCLNFGNEDHLKKCGEILKDHDSEIVAANLTNVFEHIGHVPNLSALPFHPKAPIIHSTCWFNPNGSPQSMVQFGWDSALPEIKGLLESLQRDS